VGSGASGIRALLLKRDAVGALRGGGRMDSFARAAVHALLSQKPARAALDIGCGGVQRSVTWKLSQDGRPLRGVPKTRWPELFGRVTHTSARSVGVALPERVLSQRATALGARAASSDAWGVFLRTCEAGNMIHETKRRGPAAVAGASPGAARASIDKREEGKLCGATRKS